MVTLPDVDTWNKLRNKIAMMRDSNSMGEHIADDSIFRSGWFEEVAKEIMEGSLLSNHAHSPAGGPAGAAHAHTHNIRVEVTPREDWTADCRKKFGPIGLIAMRLNKYTKAGRLPGLEAIFIHELPERVIIFVVTTEGKTVTLEDTEDLFPSDTLITQLRLLGT